MPATATIASYQVVYQVTRYQSPPAVDEIEVSRPYLGRYVERQGVKTVEGWLTNTSGGWYWNQNGWSRIGLGEQPATDDYDLIPPLRLALSLGDAYVIGHRSVLGRNCTLVRTGSPIGEPLAAATPGNYDDICVDPTGVELTDRWVYKSKLLQTKTATSFDPGAMFSPATFAAKPAGPTLSPSLLQSASLNEATSAFATLPYLLR
ncbi:MAG: hypothetical protein JO368_05585, partial [Acidimicrobiales bacterium]|nr:hypothetical protein [Acidimicrobiales bacterium]